MADIRDRMQQLEQQRQAAQRDIQQQSREAQERARAERSRLEAEKQSLLEESRKRQAQLERQRFAPTTDREKARKEIEEAEQQREEIEKRAGELEQEIKEIQTDIEQAEKAAGQEVEKKAQEIKGELETTAAQIKEFEESHIKLDYIDPETKEPQWVSKETWEELDPEQQKELQELGVEKFNELQKERIAEAEAEIAEYEANTIELDYIDPETKEPQRVDIDLFASLDPEQQTKLRELGVEEYNKWVESQNVQANEEHAKTTWDQLQGLLDAGGITTSINYTDWLDYDPDKRIERYQYIIDNHFQSLSTGEIVPNKVWESLQPEQQKQLNELGIDGFNKLQEQESWDSFNQLFEILEKKPGITRQQWAQMTPENRQETYETHLNANFVKLKAGGYYPKTPFNAMPPEEQDRLNKLGVEGYNDYLDKNFYPVQGGYLPKGFVDGIENKEHRDYILKNGLKAYQDKYLQKLDYIDTETGENQWITQDSYNELSPEEKKEINRYGVKVFQQRQEERLDKYFNELPPAAKEWVSKNSREKYLDIVNNAGQDKKGFEALKYVGVIHPYAEYKGVDKDGNFEYTIRRADLKNIDFNNLTGDDFWLIVEAVEEDYPTTQREAAKYITPFGGTGKIYDKRTQASIDKWLKTLTPAQREAFIKAEKKAAIERVISILSFAFPPARALREDVTIKDITGIEWAMGLANVGLMVVAPGLGAAGKIGGTIGKVAQVAGKTVQAGSVLTFPAITISEIAKGNYEGKPIDLAIDLAIDAAILGAVFGKPLLKGIKEIGNKIGDFAETSKAYEGLAKAIKSGDVTKIRAAATELNKLSGKGNMRGNVISQQANYVMANAERIASKAMDFPKDALDDIKRMSDRIAETTRSGEAGGTITEFAKKNPDAFKKLPDDVNKTAQKWVEQGKLTADAQRVGMTTDEFARFLEARASNPKLTPLEWIMTQIKLEPTIEKMLADLGKATPMEGSEIAKLMGQGIKKAQTTKVAPAITKKITSDAKEITKSVWASFDRTLPKKAKLTEFEKWKLRYAKQQLAREGQIPLASGISKAEDAIVGIEIASQKAARLKTLVDEAAARAAKANAFKPSLSPSASLKKLLNTNMLTVVLAHSAEPVIKAMQQVDTKTKTKVYEQVSPQIKQVLQQAVDTGAQTSIEKTESIAQAEIKAYTDAIALAEAETIAEVSSLAKTDALTNEDPAVAAAQLAAVSYAQARAMDYPEEQAEELAKEDVKELIEAMAVTSVGAATKVVPKDEVKTIDPAIKIKPVKPIDKIKTTKIRILRIRLPDDTEKELTEEELEGAIAWKQGFMYILIFPPYGEKNIAYSREPFPGVRTVDGAQSAFITATRIGGKVPEKLARKLGFFDLKITTPKGGKPKLKYTRRIGKTEYEGEKTLNAAIKGAK